jgi:hypothetical protein
MAGSGKTIEGDSLVGQLGGAGHRGGATADFSPAFQRAIDTLDSSTLVAQLKVRGAADSIEPGVERSGTPGSLFEKKSKPAERPRADSSRLTSYDFNGYRPLRGLRCYWC